MDGDTAAVEFRNKSRFDEKRTASTLARGPSTSRKFWSRAALDAFARMDTVAAAQIVRDDEAIDDEFEAFARNFVTYMMEDPRTISIGLDYLFIAKAIERIGDHATNIAEFVVYVVKGTDVRHVPRERLERSALGS